MRAKHTKGPWRVNRRDKHRISAGRNTPVAETLGAELMETDHANARLIAAAPRLLAALKGALEIIRYHEDEGPSPQGNGWQSEELKALVAEVNAAIKDAEGE